MPIIAKIILIALLSIIPIALIIFIKSRLRGFSKTTNYLRIACTAKTTARLWHFKNATNGKHPKWIALYRYNYKNAIGVYQTPPMSEKIPKPKKGHKITLMVNPLNPKEAYDPKTIDMMADTKDANTRIAIITSLIGLINLTLIVLIIRA